MSTLKVNRIEPRTGGTIEIVGFAPETQLKAWVNFNGTGTVAIRESLNVSSITDLDAGYYQLNFSTALVDANYSAIAVAAPSGDNTNPKRCNVFGNNATNPSYVAPTVNSFTIITSANAGLSDAPALCVAVFR